MDDNYPDNTKPWPEPMEDWGDVAQTRPKKVEALVTALNKQVGGNHYKNMHIQPAEYCYVNDIGGNEAAVISYVSRWKNKNGVEDLKKAIHTLELLIELYERHGP